MIRVIPIFTITVLTSFAIFPFFFSFLPAINTKMFLAVMGILAFSLDYINGCNQLFVKRLFNISMWALGVSFCSFLSMTLNNTPDDSYLEYLISMWVWLFAAYICIRLMRLLHGSISVETIGYYLMAVALLQCTLAILIHHIPFIENLVGHYVAGEKYMGVGVGKGRLYGIGCALDVGGGRLGAILIIVMYLILQAIKRQASQWKLIGLLVVFFYVFVCANMMGRTATVGGAIALAYGIYMILQDQGIRSSGSMKPFLKLSSIVIVTGILVCVGLYNTSSEFYKLSRFGFEAFFNYFEHGKFETSSTNMLSEGMIFPDDLRTWIIGDGYMASGSNDPYYIGPSDYGFYMNTDAGYSRFLFYFGLVGLSVFCAFFMNVCRICVNQLGKSGFLFVAILALNFCIWIKVSTDLFMIFAPFLCLDDESLLSNSESHETGLMEAFDR